MQRAAASEQRRFCVCFFFFFWFSASCSNDDETLGNEVDASKHSNTNSSRSRRCDTVRLKRLHVASYSLVSSDSLMHNAQNMRIRFTDIWLQVIQDMAALRGWPCTYIYMYENKSWQTQTHTQILYILGRAWLAVRLFFFLLIRAIISQQQTDVQQPVVIQLWIYCSGRLTVSFHSTALLFTVRCFCIGAVGFSHFFFS